MLKCKIYFPNRYCNFVDLFFWNYASLLITKEELIQSCKRQACMKLEGLSQIKYCLQTITSLAQRWTAKFAVLLVNSTLKLVKAEAIRYVLLQDIAPNSDRCVLLLRQSETTRTCESVSTMMCSLVLAGISRTPSRSTSAYVTRAKSTKLSQRAKAMHSICFLYYDIVLYITIPFLKFWSSWIIKICQFQLVSQAFSIIFILLITKI
jgi:hypothetical protein